MGMYVKERNESVSITCKHLFMNNNLQPVSHPIKKTSIVLNESFPRGEIWYVTIDYYYYYVVYCTVTLAHWSITNPVTTLRTERTGELQLSVIKSHLELQQKIKGILNDTDLDVQIPSVLQRTMCLSKFCCDVTTQKFCIFFPLDAHSPHFYPQQVPKKALVSPTVHQLLSIRRQTHKVSS